MSENNCHAMLSGACKLCRKTMIQAKSRAEHGIILKKKKKKVCSSCEVPVY